MALVLAGVLQLLFGILRAGRFISLVPASVIKGMLAAIGILLIMQQIPVALGSAEETGLADIVQGNATFSLSAIAVAPGRPAGAMAVGFAAYPPGDEPALDPRPADRCPARLCHHCINDPCRATAACLPCRALPLPEFGSLGDLLGELESPAWSAWRNPSVWVVALTLALVASLETLLSQEALKKTASAKSAAFAEPRNGRPWRRQPALRRTRGDADHRGHRPQLGQRQQRRTEQTVDLYPRRTATDLRTVV